MSYQVLARKWRPKFFTEVVGQGHALKILSNALSLGRVHHAYLFSGTRGVGKTSIARLLAKGLNCESGITATPCGVCDNCRDIDQGRFVDLLEIDAASRTKVEDTREILDNIQYLPTKGRFKVYLIDEVHMLSRSSFNALLKTLEEPPEHVKFLLATTDPQKLPITILSRCLHLHLSVLDTASISTQLVHILQVEQIDNEPKAIQLLAKAANGSMRDALSLTDQAIALGNGKIDTSSVSVMLGTLDKAIPFSLVEALFNGDGGALMQQIEVAARQGADWDNLLAESIALLHQIALLQVVPTALGDYSDNEERIRFLAQYMAPNDVQLFYQILLMGRKELAFSPDKKIGVEMSFLRALAFIPKVNYAVKPTVEMTNQLLSQPKITTEQQPLEQNSLSSQGLSSPDIDKKLFVDTLHQVDDKAEYQSQPTDSASLIPDDTSSITKNILEMRMQLMKGEQSAKKSEQVEVTQPKNKLTNNRFAHLENRVTTEQKDSVIEYENDDNEVEQVTAENYQWQSTGLIENKEESTPDTKAFKASLDGSISVEMTQKLIDELVQKDAWCAEVESLDLSPLVKQIVINSSIEQGDDELIILHMRSSVKHLIKSSTNIEKLERNLSNHRKREVKIKIIIDDDQVNKTPLEMREELYQQKLEQAKQVINRDEKVSMICQYFEAKIDETSIRPV